MVCIFLREGTFFLGDGGGGEGLGPQRGGSSVKVSTKRGGSYPFVSCSREDHTPFSESFNEDFRNVTLHFSYRLSFAFHLL